MDFSNINALEKAVKDSDRGIPKHIAFIMDGNGRWAKKRGLPRVAGHNEGVSAVRTMIEAGVELGVECMTFYTFSTENWKRPRKEVSALMKLLVTSIRKEVNDLNKNNVTLRTIGNLDDLPDGPRKELELAKKKLSNNNGLTLTLALSYGSRQEILRAVNRLIDSEKKNITEEMLAEAMDSPGIPDPDLLIRTSGENRLSNFLLWQIAYSEILFTEKFWPEFRKRELLEAIWDYQNRERRFGCTSEQLAK
jgi:undecaprenyl diphosphate synthase